MAQTEAAASRLSRARAFVKRHPVGVTIVGTLTVATAIAYGLWDKRDAFASALTDASWWILGLAILLQVIWLIARSEAWHVCVDAAGGSVNRRRLYRASSVGYLGNLFNSHIGMGVRIAALRRSAPKESPNVSALITAEMPIIVIEIALAAICSFTLVGPLGLPWWLPLVFVGAGAAIVGAITRLSRGHREGFWKGLAVMRGLGMRNRIIALVVFATGAQVVRNWLVLEGLGVDVTVLRLGRAADRDGGARPAAGRPDARRRHGDLHPRHQRRRGRRRRRRPAHGDRRRRRGLLRELGPARLDAALAALPGPDLTDALGRLGRG